MTTFFDPQVISEKKAYELVKTMANEKPGLLGTWKATAQGLEKINALEHFIEICKGLVYGWMFQGYQNSLNKELVGYEFIQILSKLDTSQLLKDKTIELINLAACNAGLVNSKEEDTTNFIGKAVHLVAKNIFEKKTAIASTQQIIDNFYQQSKAVQDSGIFQNVIIKTDVVGRKTLNENESDKTLDPISKIQDFNGLNDKVENAFSLAIASGNVAAIKALIKGGAHASHKNLDEALRQDIDNIDLIQEIISSIESFREGEASRVLNIVVNLKYPSKISHILINKYKANPLEPFSLLTMIKKSTKDNEKELGELLEKIDEKALNEKKILELFSSIRQPILFEPLISLIGKMDKKFLQEKSSQSSESVINNIAAAVVAYTGPLYKEQLIKYGADSNQLESPLSLFNLQSNMHSGDLSKYRRSISDFQKEFYPLKKSFIFNDLILFELALKAGASSDHIVEKNPYPFLSYAIESKNFEAVRLLLEYGATLLDEDQGKTVLERLIEQYKANKDEKIPNIINEFIKRDIKKDETKLEVYSSILDRFNPEEFNEILEKIEVYKPPEVLIPTAEDRKEKETSLTTIITSVESLSKEDEEGIHLAGFFSIKLLDGTVLNRNFSEEGFSGEGLTGTGTITYKDGDLDKGYFEGQFVNGKMTGKGKITYSNGNIYEGNFVESKMEGEGTITFKNLSRYKANWKDGKPVPEERELAGRKFIGTLEFPDSKGGEVYGDFQNGSLIGKCKLLFNNGTTYVGDFVNGILTGKCKLEFKDGAIYEGDYVKGNRDGKGKWTFPNGDVYEGNFINNKMTGKGKWIYSNGDVYEGDFVNGKRSGQGKYTLKDKVFVGEFLNDQPIKGTLTDIDSTAK